MNKEEKLKDWCYKHSIRILDKNKRAHRYHKVSLDFFKYSDDFNMIKQDLIECTEPLYTVEIAESELHKMVDFESQVFNNLQQHGHHNIFEALMEQKEQEKRLRDKYSAVKKAYEQYSLMLKLAQSGEL